ncbi:thiol reductant ABC exporter subunit CydC [Solwaraspora sp. WMMD1047]|uniref:thiol reductant ABC exporter subunit CydC n=1 Tax=Solwaraspora sp. WMMD1047 TaxID=3016102 RepID=UPI0024175426|nr:thiol reductant ABC exporter subunit CydC [Solwaraspora sp. WMMD1047]MDG4833358.1 thiol reductant ABC exporter subunit CydC [Solwaraspora sp. WMMD1047]
MLTPERAVLRLARPYLGRLVGAGLLAAGTELAGLALMATATWLLITAAGRPPLDALTVAIVAVRALAISRGVLRYTERLAGHDAVLRIITDVRAGIFASLAAGGPGRTVRTTAPDSSPAAGVSADVDGSGVEDGGGAGGGAADAVGGDAGPVSGDALSRLVSDVEAVQDLLLRVLVPAAAAGVVGLLAVAGAATISPVAAAVLAGGLLVAAVALPGAATALTRRTADRVAPLRGALATDAIDLTQGAADLAAFGATGTALARADQRARELARLEGRLAAAGWALDGLGLLVAGATSAAVVAVAVRGGVDGVLVGVLGVGTLAAVEATLALVGAARQWTQLRAGLTRVVALLPAADAIPAGHPTGSGRTASGDLSGDGGTPVPGHSTGGGAAVDARLIGTSVRYRAGAPPALDRVDLALPPGRRVAVVGPSGAGKSTLLGVLTGAVRPTAGRVTLAGVDLADYPARRLPRAVSGLLAEAHVFHATVRENLLVGRAGADDDDLAAAARTAGLLDWVRDQPDGWETIVGADGGQLSGGQRQRLALARALLAAPAILLLDEPTEGLDPPAADRVLDSIIESLPADRSVVLVTHRLRGLDRYDEIVVLDEGRVVQRGPHDDLVAADGWYRDQWLRQEVAERGYLALSGPGQTPGPD